MTHTATQNIEVSVKNKNNIQRLFDSFRNDSVRGVGSFEWFLLLF